MTIEERLLEEVQVHFEEDEFDEKVIKICIRRAINAFKSKRNYPSSYDDEKINKDLERCYDCIFELVLCKTAKQGVEGESLHIESGVHRTYMNEEQIYADHGIFPFVSCF